MKIIIILLLLTSNYSAYGQFSYKLNKIDSCLYQLLVHTNDSVVLKKRLPFVVFRDFACDIDNSGEKEIILGVIKKTVFDSTLQKRINIFTVTKHAIEPLWLGSKMPNRLYDFEIQTIAGVSYIFTIEYERNGTFLLSKYIWHSFGLKFLSYIERNISLTEAIHKLHSSYE